MPINVFIVDDSAVMRQVLSEIIKQDASLTVIGSAPDPIIAERKMQQQWPDVILLDIEMPKMNGITFLKKIMADKPTPIVICSNISSKGANITMEALSSGAVDVICKPNSNLGDYLRSDSVNEILDALKAAAKARVKPVKPLGQNAFRPKENADAVLRPQTQPMQHVNAPKVIVIGASTGGTEAITTFLQGMPAHSPPMVIVQHMPDKFTKAFAERLNQVTKHTVKEAENAECIKKGMVYIAPGNFHLLIKRQGKEYFLEVRDGPLVSRHKPSVDVLFRSAAQDVGDNCIAVILTGMGDDGAQGMLELRNSGAMTYAESEKSCVVFGMPKEAIAKGGVHKVYSIENLPYQVHKFLVS